MRILTIVVALTFAIPAHAVPAGRGYELVVEDGMLVVKKGKRKAPVARRWSTDFGDLSVDDKARTVSLMMPGDCDMEETTTFTLDFLESRLLNADGLALHRKKQWAKAAPLFAKAAKLDPTWKLAAYNLASAYTRLGDHPKAIAALASRLASEPIQTYIQVSLDPELQPLLADKELAALRAATPTSAKVKDGRLDVRYGYNATTGMVSAQVEQSDGMSCRIAISVVFFDGKTGKKLGSIPLSSTTPDCEQGKQTPLLEMPGRDKIVEKLVADFGLTSTTFEFAESTTAPSGTYVVRFPKAKLGVASNDLDKVNVLRGNDVIASGKTGEDRLIFGAYLDAAKLVIVGTHRPSDSCPFNSVDAVVVP